MNKMGKTLLAAALMGAMATAVQADDKVLHVYNWSDYIAPDTVANFEKQTGIKVVYDVYDSNKILETKLLAGGTGYDDVICFAPVRPVVEQSDAILAVDGCLNFFAGPSDQQFSAMMNFYNVHYKRTHVTATSHGNTDDMREAIQLMNEGKTNPASLITHIGGLDCAAETTQNLPKIPGGKKLIYTHISMPLTAIADFAELGKTDPLFAELDKLVKEHNGLWNGPAEKLLLEKAKRLA